MGEVVAPLLIGTAVQISKKQSHDDGAGAIEWISIVNGGQDAGEGAVFVTRVAEQNLISRELHNPFQFTAGDEAAVAVAEAVLGNLSHQIGVGVGCSLRVERFAEETLGPAVGPPGFAPPGNGRLAKFTVAAVRFGEVGDVTAVQRWVVDIVLKGNFVAFQCAGVVAHDEELPQPGTGRGLVGEIEGDGRFQTHHLSTMQKKLTRIPQLSILLDTDFPRNKCP